MNAANGLNVLKRIFLKGGAIVANCTTLVVQLELSLGTTVHNLKEVDIEAIVQHESMMLETVLKGFVNGKEAMPIVDQSFFDLQTAYRRKKTFEVQNVPPSILILFS